MLSEYNPTYVKHMAFSAKLKLRHANKKVLVLATKILVPSLNSDVRELFIHYIIEANYYLHSSLMA